MGEEIPVVEHERFRVGSVVCDEVNMHAHDILTPLQVAEYTGYSTRSLTRWRAKKLIRSVGLEHRPRYRRADVDALLLGLSGLGAPIIAAGAGRR